MSGTNAPSQSQTDNVYDEINTAALPMNENKDVKPQSILT